MSFFNTSGLTKIFVASGFTSSLFANLIPFIRYSSKEVVGIVRPTTDQVKLKHQEYLKSEGFELCVSNDISSTVKNFFFNRKDLDEWRILWFSTHDEPEALRECSRYAPTLAIGSGAMVDYYLKIIPHSNDYIDGKVRMALTHGVTVLCFGFYLEDDPNIQLTPGGLHHETTRVLLGYNSAPEDYKWTKGYYLTPKTFACEAIVRWMANPQNKLGKWYHVGTSRAYSRAEIAKILGTSVPENVASEPFRNTYSNLAHDFAVDFGIQCTDKNIAEALTAVKVWAKRQYKKISK